MSAKFAMCDATTPGTSYVIRLSFCSLVSAESSFEALTRVGPKMSAKTGPIDLAPASGAHNFDVQPPAFLADPHLVVSQIGQHSPWPSLTGSFIRFRFWVTYIQGSIPSGLRGWYIYRPFVAHVTSFFFLKVIGYLPRN